MSDARRRPGRTGPPRQDTPEPPRRAKVRPAG